MAELIRLENVTKTYRAGEVDVPALRGIDLLIQQNERVVIMGRSGSGKSTLMNIIGCLDKPTTGRYVLQGRDVGSMHDDHLSALRGRTIGFVFQGFHLLNGMSILENVELPMEYQQIPLPERTQRAGEMLERVGLGHRLQHRPKQLSGGEQQRVAIARALVNQPQIILADEPTGNLDSAARRQILDLFLELQREIGITMILVTHDLEVGEIAQRVVQVEDGRIVEGGANA